MGRRQREQATADHPWPPRLNLRIRRRRQGLSGYVFPPILSVPTFTPSYSSFTPSPLHSLPNRIQVPREAPSATESASCAPSRRRSTKSWAGISPAASQVLKAPPKLLPVRRRPQPSARLTTLATERGWRLRRRARGRVRSALLARRRRRGWTVVRRMEKRR